jgi:hypothetical protein
MVVALEWNGLNQNLVRFCLLNHHRMYQPLSLEFLPQVKGVVAEELREKPREASWILTLFL